MTRLLYLSILLVAGCGKDGRGGADGKDGPGGANGDSFKNADGIEVVECDGRFRECGGDPTGAWEIYAVCDPGIDIDVICDKASIEITRDRSEGTLDLNDDGSWDRVLHVDLDYDVTVPASCLGGFMTCSVLENLSGTVVKKCREKNNGGCSCNGTFKTTIRKDGTWEKKGPGFVTEDGRTDICIDGQVMDSVDEDGVRVLWE